VLQRSVPICVVQQRDELGEELDTLECIFLGKADRKKPAELSPETFCTLPSEFSSVTRFAVGVRNLTDTTHPKRELFQRRLHCVIGNSPWTT
jgi:hypothetical protein